MQGLVLREAIECFGEYNTEKVIQDSQWRELYPQVFERLDSMDPEVRLATSIPLPMLKQMAVLARDIHAFGVHNNVLRCSLKPEDFSADYEIITVSEALERFGSRTLFHVIAHGTMNYE